MIKSMVVACDSEMENVKQIQQEFAAFKIAFKFITINDMIGFVKDTETVEDPSGWSTRNESRENAKIIQPYHPKIFWLVSYNNRLHRPLSQNPDIRTCYANIIFKETLV